jgi:hypothetical protein
VFTDPLAAAPGARLDPDQVAVSAAETSIGGRFADASKEEDQSKERDFRRSQRHPRQPLMAIARIPLHSLKEK